jgi:hypothetical protein
VRLKINGFPLELEKKAVITQEVEWRCMPEHKNGRKLIMGE